MFQLSLVYSLKLGATLLYLKSLKRVFNAFIKPFAVVTIVAFSFVGCALHSDEESNAKNSQSPTIIDAETPKIDVQPYKVSFYDANLDFNASIMVQANSSINIAQLKNDLDLNATALYLADGTETSHIGNASYQVKQNVNLYAVPNVKEISDETKLNSARKNLSDKYILLNDINLTSVTLGKYSGKGWNPIGDYDKRFTGVFNGNGYVIRNLWIDRQSTNFIGLFGYIDNAQIKNLGVEIDNGKGGVKGKDIVGGIAGFVSASSITNSYSTGNVSGVYNVGGIAGDVRYFSITNSYSTGNVSGVYNVGGIAGYVYSLSITNSYSTGNVSGKYYVGGIAGNVLHNSSIANSYSIGNVSGDHNVGGIAGYVRDSPITNSYSMGDVSGDHNVGGIAGVVDYSTIKNNVAINQKINGLSNVNRVAGEINRLGNIDRHTVQNNFAFVDTATNRGGFSNASVPANHGTSKTIAALKSQSTYSDAISGDGLGWRLGNDDANPWKIDPSGIKNNGYPYLYWQKL